jgi:hypothetical protein
MPSVDSQESMNELLKNIRLIFDFEEQFIEIFKNENEGKILRVKSENENRSKYYIPSAERAMMYHNFDQQSQITPLVMEDSNQNNLIEPSTYEVIEIFN